MRHTFAHDAVVAMEAGGDIRAPGGAVTVALCGTWQHEPPCPLAAHHTTAERTAQSDEVRLRVLFAAEPAAEARIRRQIETALSSSGLGAGFQGPDGLRTRWQLREAGPSSVRAEEADHAARLSRPD
ncbi:hypothetical protein J4573_44615 [Actinomadura barringtoniae]|uniref:Uncharacterized protein n=1 Tax=Actinomadura barringtoniae TaxID=1427535 RepID=A0A939T5W6_9ACTN|nr:hypothetical protein [Actinomadura barringtoniae]MBO2454236.1 hypothetical protein [Actinomadura barringtoniae]